MNATPVRVTRDVAASDEHNYLGRDVKEGEIFYRFTGHTYGCIREYDIRSGYRAVALSEVPDEYPFFEFPADAIEDADARSGYKGMGTT